MSNQNLKRLIFLQVDLPSFLEQETGRKMRKMNEGSYKCHCPFPEHKDNNPSFSVDYRDGGWKWYCYGCGEGGGVIQFYRKYFGVSEDDAIQSLCEMYDIHDDPQSFIRSMERMNDETPYKRDMESYFMRTSIACRTLLRDYPGDKEVLAFVKTAFEKSNEYLASMNLEATRELFDKVQCFVSGEKIEL